MAVYPVVAGIAVQLVSTQTAHDDVVTIAAIGDVIAVTTFNSIIAPVAVDDVVAAEGKYLIGVFGAINGVCTVRAHCHKVGFPEIRTDEILSASETHREVVGVKPSVVIQIGEHDRVRTGEGEEYVSEPVATAGKCAVRRGHRRQLTPKDQLPIEFGGQAQQQRVTTVHASTFEISHPILHLGGRLRAPYRPGKRIESCAAGELVGAKGTEEILALKDVVAAAAVQYVIANAAHQGVIVVAAREDVVSGVTENEIQPGASRDLVVVGSAAEDVITDTTVDEVVAGTAVGSVVSGAAVDLVVPVAAKQGDVSREISLIVAVAAVDDIVAASAIDAIGAVEAVHGIIATKGEDDIVAGCAIDGVVSICARDHEFGSTKVGGDQSLRAVEPDSKVTVVIGAAVVGVSEDKGIAPVEGVEDIPLRRRRQCRARYQRLARREAHRR